MTYPKILAFVATLTFSTIGMAVEKAASMEAINVNTANQQQLTSLNGVGVETAKDIIEYREAHGEFKSLEDFDKVKGIGSKLLEKNKERILFK